MTTISNQPKHSDYNPLIINKTLVLFTTTCSLVSIHDRLLALLLEHLSGTSCILTMDLIGWLIKGCLNSMGVLHVIQANILLWSLHKKCLDNIPTNNSPLIIMNMRSIVLFNKATMIHDPIFMYFFQDVIYAWRVMISSMQHTSFCETSMVMIVKRSNF